MQNQNSINHEINAYPMFSEFKENHPNNDCRSIYVASQMAVSTFMFCQCENICGLKRKKEYLKEKRNMLISYLSSYIATDDCKQLLLSK